MMRTMSVFAWCSNIVTPCRAQTSFRMSSKKAFGNIFSRRQDEAARSRSRQSSVSAKETSSRNA